MKKVLLIGLILAILLLAFPQGVLADTAQINAAVVEYSSFSATGTVTGWNLYFAPVSGVPASALAPVNTNTDGLNLAVSLNNPWHITVLGTNNGQLRPYISSAYTGTALALPLRLEGSGGQDQAVTGAAANLVANVGRTNGWTKHFDYQQTLTVADDPLSTYQIVLTVDLVNEG